MDEDETLEFENSFNGVQEPIEPAEPIVEEVPVEPAEPVEPEKAPEPQHVPITALLDERDKRRAMEQELEGLRAALQPAQTPQVPDMFEDPEGYHAYQVEMANSATLNAKLDISEEMARDKFGDEKVEAAKAWALQAFQTRPGFQQEVLRQRNPYRYAVEQYEKEQFTSSVTPDDFAQFQAWKAAQSQIQPQTKPQAPPRSLASAPSAGDISTDVVPTEEEAFAATFKR